MTELYRLKETDQRGFVLERFMRKFSKEINQQTFCELLAEEMLRIHNYKNSQRYALYLGVDFGLKLLALWEKQVSESELPLIYGRFALLYAFFDAGSWRMANPMNARGYCL